MRIMTKQDLYHYVEDATTRVAALAHLQMLLDERYEWVDGVWGVNPNALFYSLGVTVEEAVALGCEDREIAEPERPSAEEMEAAQAKAEALADLADLDALAIRPLRAITAGTATEIDRNRLASLEGAAVELRAVIQGE